MQSVAHSFTGVAGGVRDRWLASCFRAACGGASLQGSRRTPIPSQPRPQSVRVSALKARVASFTMTAPGCSLSSWPRSEFQSRVHGLEPAYLSLRGIQTAAFTSSVTVDPAEGVSMAAYPPLDRSTGTLSSAGTYRGRPHRSPVSLHRAPEIPVLGYGVVVRVAGSRSVNGDPLAAVHTRRLGGDRWTGGATVVWTRVRDPLRAKGREMGGRGARF